MMRGYYNKDFIFRFFLFTYQYLCDVIPSPVDSSGITFLLGFCGSIKVVSKDLAFNSCTSVLNDKYNGYVLHY